MWFQSVHASGLNAPVVCLSPSSILWLHEMQYDVLKSSIPKCCFYLGGKKLIFIINTSNVDVPFLMFSFHPPMTVNTTLKNEHLVQTFCQSCKDFLLLSGYHFILAINSSIILYRMKNVKPQQDVCCIRLNWFLSPRSFLFQDLVPFLDGRLFCNRYVENLHMPFVTFSSVG